MSLFVIRLLPLFFIACLLTSCASLSKEQCNSGMWYQIGEVDGMRGRSLDIFDRHVKACKNYNVSPDLALYKKGRQTGLKSYCKVQHQVDLGVKGEEYNDVCEGKIVALLKEANTWGLLYHQKKQTLFEVERQLSEVRDELNDKKLEAKEERKLQREERQLEREISNLRLELARMKLTGEEILTKKAQAY